MSQTKLTALKPKPKSKAKKRLQSSLPNKAIEAELEKPIMIEMRSETLPSRTVNADDREGRINYTLDMVVHDLISQGHVSASRAAYMLKSPEMKEHVGRLCDEMSRRRKEGPKASKARIRSQSNQSSSNNSARTSQVVLAGSPLSTLSETGLRPVRKTKIAKKRTVKEVPEDTESSVRSPVSRKKSLTRTESSVRSPGRKKSVTKTESSVRSLGRKKSVTVTKTESSVRSLGAKKSVTAAGAESTVRTRIVRKKSIAVVPPKVSTLKLNKATKDTTTGEVKPVKMIKTVSILKTQPTDAQIENGIDDVPSNPQLNQVFNFPPTFVPYETDASAYRTRVDLGGFSNENISLDLDGRRLIVVAFRPKDKYTHARKITEVVDIPDNVELQNLKIGRRPDGSMVVEEIVPDRI